jgi:hypothetical protein
MVFWQRGVATSEEAEQRGINTTLALLEPGSDNPEGLDV